MSFTLPVPISAEHELEAFDCRNESLNQYLKRFALANSTAGISRSYVTTLSGRAQVVGYYSLAAGSVEKASVPERVGKGIPRHPVPVVLLARLAVDRGFQRGGVGKGLLRDALQRALAAADVIGIRAVLVHAKDETAAAFYKKFGFEPSPTDLLHLMVLMKDLKRSAQTG